ncbi:MAG: methylenetetrahydrofolate reductase [NAD(P)H] [Actinomycetota bacterium]|nr:methylenetetrahydrofolate reductase [NAD(P)H] [Actinomycetota bacterium]
MPGRTIRELLAAGGRSFSFEFFPPKTDEGEAALWRAIRELEPLGPTFVSVTYGAGGSTRDRTVRIVQRIAAETSLTPVAHLTCVAASREQVRATIRQIAAAGIRNVLALRGDMPGGPDQRWEAHADGLRHADDLVRLLHEEGDFCVGVAAFPETHPESPDRATDVRYLARKCAAGADFAITQFFFDPADYFELLDAAREAGCRVPVIPGVMPVTNVRQIQKFALLSGAQFPPDLARRLHAVEDDPEAVRAVGVEVASDLCRKLLDGGAPGIHFYTLNRSTATREIYQQLGLGPGYPGILA